MRVHAKAARLDTGIAAYHAVHEAYPDRKLTLRHGIRVILDSTTAS